MIDPAPNSPALFGDRLSCTPLGVQISSHYCKRRGSPFPPRLGFDGFHVITLMIIDFRLNYNRLSSPALYVELKCHATPFRVVLLASLLLNGAKKKGLAWPQVLSSSVIAGGGFEPPTSGL
jgi:hypothetical protein